MKANAPEKIYRRREGKYIKYYDYKPAKISYDEKEPTEYTRTDAFIEKACEWIMNHFSSEGFGSPLYYKGFLYRPEDIVEDFKKDMKGE